MSFSSRNSRTRGDAPASRPRVVRRPDASSAPSAGRQQRATDAVISQWLVDTSGRRGPVIAGAAARSGDQALS
jgi:hypothetical protein